MQAWKPPVQNEQALAKSQDGKIELSSVTLPARGNKAGKSGILVRFVNVYPGSSNPDRYDVMSDENWAVMLGSHLPSLQNAFSGIVEAKKKAEQERRDKALKTVETIKATGLPPVAANAAIMATLTSEGWKESEIKALVAA